MIIGCAGRRVQIPKSTVQYDGLAANSNPVHVCDVDKNAAPSPSVDDLGTDDNLHKEGAGRAAGGISDERHLSPRLRTGGKGSDAAGALAPRALIAGKRRPGGAV